MTEQKKIQDQLKFQARLLEVVEHAVIVTETDGRVIYWNPFAEKLYGYTAKEAIGKTTIELISDEKTKEYGEQTMQRLKEGENRANEFLARCKNGEYKTIHVSANPIYDEKGNVTHLIGISYDITQKKQAEENLKKMNQELLEAKEKAEESDRLKTEFLQNLSHEIRTPMNGILGFSSFLSEPNLEEEKRKYYSTMVRNCGQQLLKIIDDILDISRLQTKQITHTQIEFSLNDLLEELFLDFNPKAKENKISLFLKKGLSDRESMILSDKISLTKILQNLVENAIRFTSEGFVEFGYTQKDNLLELYVKDSGIGISSERHESIFTRFSQGQTDISNKTGGLGLGLSIVKEFVDILNGNIKLVSDKEKGATFFITIPFIPANRTYGKNTDVTILENKLEYSILVAEDEEINFFIIETFLQKIIKCKFELLHVTDGRQAVEICQNNPNISLVFMDIKMPIMDGYSATLKIKEIHPNLPVVAQTAYSREEDKKRALSSGCDDFLSKPLNEEKLTEIIEKYLPSSVMTDND